MSDIFVITEIQSVIHRLEKKIDEVKAEIKAQPALTFEEFEKYYVETHGQCESHYELTRFFNLAKKLGLTKS